MKEEARISSILPTKSRCRGGSCRCHAHPVYRVKYSRMAGKSLSARISLQRFSEKSLQSSYLISFVNCSSQRRGHGARQVFRLGSLSPAFPFPVALCGARLASLTAAGPLPLLTGFPFQAGQPGYHCRAYCRRGRQACQCRAGWPESQGRRPCAMGGLQSGWQPSKLQNTPPVHADAPTLFSFSQSR